MDAETIRGEASAAIEDLELESSVSNVAQSGQNWCVQFEGDYGQYCDSFKNQFERDNSPRVIREKIKKHLLSQITQLRNKGGRRTTKKGFDDEAGRANMTELLQEAVTQTTRAIGEVVERTLSVTGSAIQSANDASETVTARASEMVRPPTIKHAPAPAATTAREGSKKRKSAGKAKKAAKKKAATKKRSSKR